MARCYDNKYPTKKNIDERKIGTKENGRNVKERSKASTKY